MHGIGPRTYQEVGSGDTYEGRNNIEGGIFGPALHNSASSSDPPFEILLQSITQDPAVVANTSHKNLLQLLRAHSLVLAAFQLFSATMPVKVQDLPRKSNFESHIYEYDPKAANMAIEDHGEVLPKKEACENSVQSWSLPLSAWQPLQHPRCEQVSREVNAYFISEWDFPGEKAERRFISADFSGVTCLYFPLAKDDRIQFACMLFTVLFLIDGKRWEFEMS